MPKNTISCPTCKQTVVKISGKYAPDPKNRACPVCGAKATVTLDEYWNWTTQKKKDLRIDISCSCDKCKASWVETTTFNVGSYKNLCFDGDC